MPTRAPDPYEWREDDTPESLLAFDRRTGADLPESLWNYDWWVAGITYSGLWLLESWTSGGSALGKDGLIHMAHGLTTLFLALAVCVALHKTWERKSERLAAIIAAVSGIAMFVAHSA